MRSRARRENTTRVHVCDSTYIRIVYVGMRVRAAERAVGPIRTRGPRERRARFLCGTRTARHGISRVPVYYARKLISAQRKVRRRPFKARVYPGSLKTPAAILSHGVIPRRCFIEAGAVCKQISRVTCAFFKQ